MTDTERQLREDNAKLGEEIERLREENRLLRQRLDLVIRRLFARNSEQLDPAQLELLLKGEEPDPPEPKKDAAPAISLLDDRGSDDEMGSG